MRLQKHLPTAAWYSGMKEIHIIGLYKKVSGINTANTYWDIID